MMLGFPTAGKAPPQIVASRRRGSVLPTGGNGVRGR